MEYPWNVVTIVLSIAFVFAVLAAIWYRAWLPWCCARLKRRDKAPRQELPKSLRHAVSTLSGITHNKGRMSQLTCMDDSHCSICLGSFLYGDLEALKNLPLEPPKARVAEDTSLDLEAGISRVTTATGSTDSSTAATLVGTTEQTDKSKRFSLQPIDDEVLQLKQCQHVFHARCLATWFLRKRYDCPLCRTAYYQPPPPPVDSVYATPNDPYYDHYRAATMAILPFW